MTTHDMTYRGASPEARYVLPRFTERSSQGIKE